MIDSSEAARLLGSIRTEKKSQAARENLAKVRYTGGRRPKPLSELACTCEAGESLEGHKSHCPRGRAIKRRRAKGESLEDGPAGARE